MPISTDLPGADLISAGVEDLRAGRETERAMRPPVDANRLRELARMLGREASEPVRLYLTGGATAVFEGWRASTVDVDMRLEPKLDACYASCQCSRSASM